MIKITFRKYKSERRNMKSILLALLCIVSLATQARNEVNSYESVGDYTNITVGSTIVLITNNGKYVSSENGRKPIIANRTRIGSWEKFTVVDAGNGKIALKGNNGKYLSSENGKKAMHCNVNHLGAWQKFKVIKLGNGKIALKGSNRKYISSENGKKPMNCNRKNIGSWEKFKVKVLHRNNCKLNAGRIEHTQKNCGGFTPEEFIGTTVNSGEIKETQANCEAFDPEEFIGDDLEEETGLTVVYQWQVKKEQGLSWEDIGGANEINYVAPRIESGSLWYRRGAKSEECGEYVYSNSVDLHVKVAPIAEVVLTNANCTDPTGDIELTFEDAEDRTHIEFSIDGGVTYTEVPDDSGSFSFNDLEVGD